MLGLPSATSVRNFINNYARRINVMFCGTVMAVMLVGLILGTLSLMGSKVKPLSCFWKALSQTSMATGLKKNVLCAMMIVGSTYGMVMTLALGVAIDRDIRQIRLWEIEDNQEFYNSDT